MFAYYKCGDLAAIYVEFSKSLGLQPFFGIKTCNEETVIDIPYGQIIFTPQKKLRQEKIYELRIEPTHYGQADQKIHTPTKGIAKN